VAAHALCPIAEDVAGVVQGEYAVHIHTVAIAVGKGRAHAALDGRPECVDHVRRGSREHAVNVHTGAVHTGDDSTGVVGHGDVIDSVSTGDAMAPADGAGICDVHPATKLGVNAI